MPRRLELRMVSAVVFAAIVTVAIPCSPSSASCSGNQAGKSRMADSLWVEDLEYLVQELPKRHKNLFFTLPEDEFHAMVDGLMEGVPDMTDYEIVVGIMEILAAVGDPHTVAGIARTNFFSRLPLVMEWYSDGLFVVEAPPEDAFILGRRVLAIEGHPIDEVQRVLARVIPGANPALLKQRGPRHMVFPEILAALGIADDPDTVVLELDSVGAFPVGAVPLDEKIQRISVLDSLGCGMPLRLRNRDQHYWLEYLENPSVLYVKYGSCTEMEERPFTAFAKEVVAALDSLHVKKLLFDMRNNGGGNSSLAGPLISAIKARPEINRRGRLFVAIGRGTFSSAILNTLEFVDGGNAILVGEPTGGKPNGYGEVRFVLLPNSMLPIQYSTKYFKLRAGDPPSIVPDISAEGSFEDLMSCRDPVLDAVLEYGTSE